MNLAAVRASRVTGEETRRTKEKDNATDEDGKTSRGEGGERNKEKRGEERYNDRDRKTVEREKRQE